MSALAANLKLQTRSTASFGYPIAAGLHVFAGALLALNAAGSLIRPQDAGAVSFAGIADREFDNSASAAVSIPGNGGFVVAQRAQTVQLTVPAAVNANIGAPVYAVDDGTLTLTNTGSLLTVGSLVGFENGLTWVRTVS